jgi:hypothetical protein
MEAEFRPRPETGCMTDPAANDTSLPDTLTDPSDELAFPLGALTRGTWRGGTVI